MKKMKKLVSLIMVLAIVLAMATVTFAAETGTIKIAGAANGVTYTFYRVFDMKDSNDLIYMTNDKWSAFVSEGGAAADYVSVSADGTIRAMDLNTEADAKAFAALVANAGIEADLTVTAGVDTANATFDAAAGELTLTDMEHGYYVVKSSRGGLFTMDTLSSSELVIKEKNAYLPGFEKAVQEDSTSLYGENNDAEIGQVMQFKLTITAAAGNDDYTVSDTMTNMEFIGVESVIINPNTAEAVTVTDSTVTPASGGSSFTITLSDDTRHSLTDGDIVEIIYTAKLTADAEIEGTGNPNTATFTYDGDQQIQDTTITYTYDVPVSKTDANGQALAGAGFTLYRANDTVIYVKATGTANEYVIVEEGTEGAQTEIVTDSTGHFTVKGLDNDDADKYTLKETTVPDGYQQADDTTFNVVDGVTVTVVNELVSELPETGGIGTTLFYIAGSALVLTAVVLLLSKKRKAVQ